MTIDRPFSALPWGAALVFFVSFLFLGILADRDGYEGDDLNSVVPLLNLDSARDGLIEIYRYDWQPLSYQFSAFVAEFLGGPGPVFLLPALSIALALAMLFGLLSRYYRVPAYAFICIVLLTPEILYSGLYYNSVALAYVAAVGALVQAFRPAGTGAAIAFGGLLGLATLLRIDFVLIIPAMLLLYWFCSGSLRWPFISGVVAMVIGLTALVTELIRFSDLIKIYEFHSAEVAAKSNDSGWNNYTKIFVASTILSPVGFVYYGLGTLWLIRRIPRSESLQGLAIAIALLPALISLPDILSVKYMLPSFVFIPLLGGKIWCEAQKVLTGWAHWLGAGVAAATVFLCFAAVDVKGQQPYVSLLFWESRQIGTHDGPRSWGAYIPQMMRVDRVSLPSETQLQGQRIASALLQGSGRTIVFLGGQGYFSSGAAGWRHAVLALAYAGVHGTVVGKGLMRLDTSGGSLWLAESLEAVPVDVLNAPEVVILDAAADNFGDVLNAL